MKNRPGNALFPSAPSFALRVLMILTFGALFMSDILPPSGDVQIRELIAWPLDSYVYRDRAMSRQQLAAASERAAAVLSPYNNFIPALDAHLTRDLRPLLSEHLSRPDLLHEYAGFDWTLGVVDLYQLLAFQRRLVLDPTDAHDPLPGPDDWPALLHFALNGSRSTACTHSIQQYTAHRIELTLRSTNPDLKLQPTTDASLPFSIALSGGTPFFEVAKLEGRWFLRDGYHRAYRLLRAGCRSTVAVVLRVDSIAELGAVQPWFFSEVDLRSERPPRVVDFLDDRLTLTYSRPRLLKTLRIHIEESLEPIQTGEQL